MPSHLIKVPAERRDQLRQLSATRGMPIAEIIGEWINREIRAGALPDTLLGIHIMIEGARISVVIDGVALDPMTPGEAVDLARAMTSIARTGGACQVQLSASSLSVERAGSGVRFCVRARTGQKARRTMACSVVRDFGRLLHTASTAIQSETKVQCRRDKE
jgi:hypothetical protein